MQTIPTIFIRDRDSQPPNPNVVNIWRADCRWVLDGEGIARRKYDGLACLVKEGRFYKRHIAHRNEQAPPDFVAIELYGDNEIVGWLPVTASPNDKWHREAIRNGLPEDGTYELVGPRINGNKDKFQAHRLIRHTGALAIDPPRDFKGLRDFLCAVQIEGIVWHRGNGDMAKIKRRDFGFHW